MNTLKPETRKIRLEPEYITKYGKSFYELCLKNHKFLSNDELFKKSKKTLFIPFWNELKENYEIYYESDDNYYSEEEFTSNIIEEDYGLENENNISDISSDEDSNIDEEFEN